MFRSVLGRCTANGNNNPLKTLTSHPGFLATLGGKTFVVCGRSDYGAMPRGQGVKLLHHDPADLPIGLDQVALGPLNCSHHMLLKICVCIVHQ